MGMEVHPCLLLNVKKKQKTICFFHIVTLFPDIWVVWYVYNNITHDKNICKQIRPSRSWTDRKQQYNLGTTHHKKKTVEKNPFLELTTRYLYWAHLFCFIFAPYQSDLEETILCREVEAENSWSWNSWQSTSFFFNLRFGFFVVCFFYSICSYCIDQFMSG